MRETYKAAEITTAQTDVHNNKAITNEKSYTN